MAASESPLTRSLSRLAVPFLRFTIQDARSSSVSGGFNSAMPYGQREVLRDRKKKKEERKKKENITDSPDCRWHHTPLRHAMYSFPAVVAIDISQYLAVFYCIIGSESTNNTRDLRHKIRPRHRIPEPRARRKRRHIERRAVRKVQERIIERPRLAVQQEHISTTSSVSTLPLPTKKQQTDLCGPDPAGGFGPRNSFAAAVAFTSVRPPCTCCDFGPTRRSAAK